MRRSSRTTWLYPFLMLVAAAACGDDDASSNSGAQGDADAGERDASTPRGGRDASAPRDAASSDDAGEPEAERAVVTIEHGELHGASHDDVRHFLGIPYAKPPVGELRWQRPEPPEAWDTPRAATQFGKRCAQANSAVLMNPASEDEDCLYLNVWTPNDAEKLPVMVWIHGGGNVNGSASELVPYTQPDAKEYFYDGEALAKKNVVLVSINYRLGVFGFLSHPALDKPDAPSGNQGLWDQVAALTWVRDNIAKFGGDPKNVTIFGESAGSHDVCLHVASPKSKGLFHRAISQSGGCSTLALTKAAAEPAATALATALECNGDDVLGCLREQQVVPLLTAAGMLPASATGGRSIGPTVDGDFMPEQPRTRYKNGDINKVPYLLGSNTDEGTLFTAGAAPISTEEEYDAALQTQYMARSEAIKALYPLDDFADGKPNPAQAALTRIAGDARLVCSTTDTALLAAAHVPAVYTYNFDIPVDPGLSPTFLGATHGAELVYVFQTSTRFGAEQTAASELMQRYWTNFARTGDPNGEKDPEWPAYSADDDKRMNFALKAPKVVDGFRAPQCALWIEGYEASFAAALAAAP
jgi:para-nitrobenzyl esterase